MTGFDPEKFEDKYVHYLPELQQAYKNAFDRMNDRYDSQLIHAIDQQVLNESEPFFEDGSFTVELPDEPFDRLSGVIVDEPTFKEILEIYVDHLERELHRVFGV